MKYRFIPLFIITFFLFIAPFFWFKPGEMDLGGDSSRLYFYDPLHYLTSQAFYAISHSGLGGEGLNYFGIPFFLFLFGLKSIFISPTFLISFLHGFSLSLAFLSCYFAVKQLLQLDEKKRTKHTAIIIEICALIAGLYYISAPTSILIWNHMLSTDNQIFLNPLTFFLLLRYLLTQNIRYLLAVLGITFLFAANFSFIGAPAFFAFYPLAIFFLLLYMVCILHKSLPWKGIIIGIGLFFLLHAFHLAPQIVSLLTPGSAAQHSVFSEEAKIDSGLGYFNALASGVKLSISLLGLQQMAPLFFSSFVFIVMPFVFILGFLWNKRKSMLLTGIFFLITLFFVTANITNVGLKFYMLLFYIPGFSMFRVFFGQWEWVYLFFYTLLLGQTLFVVLTHIRKWQSIPLVLFLLGFLLIIAWPFISGKTLQYFHWQTKHVSAIVAIDPNYEDVLSCLRSLPIDGKILSLPLTDPGYQVVKGKNNAAYEGPSMITYLAGRNEFTGFAEFESFGPSFLQAVKEKNYVAIRDILSMLNIRYIYYNEDPYIYGNNFPGQPYISVRDFFPDTQEGYKQLIKDLIKNLGIKEIKTIAGKYHIYELDGSSYLPHIYVAKKTTYWNDYIVNLHTPLSFYANDKRIAFYDDSKILERHSNLFDDLFLKAKNNSAILDFFKVKKLPRFVSPTVSQKLSSLLYPVIVLREKIDLSRFKTMNDVFIDRSVYFMEKRINELTKWSEEIPIRGNVESITDLSNMWREPKLWEFQRYKEYNSWEVTLVRYQRSTEKLVDQLEKTTQSGYSVITNKVELKSDLIKHENKLRKAIREDGTQSINEKKYLLDLIDGMFSDIFVKLNLPLPDYWNISYEVNNSSLDGAYQVYLNKEDVKDFNSADIKLKIDGKTLPFGKPDGEWIRFDDINLKGKTSFPISLTVHNFPDLTEQTKWNTAEQTDIGVDGQVQPCTVVHKESGKDLITLAITNNLLDDTSGLVRNIQNWVGNSVYIVSFDYLTYNQNFLMSLYEKGGTKNNQYVNSAYDEIIRSKAWKKFNAVILSKKDAESAFLRVTKVKDDIPDSNVKKIEIKNLSVVKIPDPEIVFKKVVRTKEVSTPQVIFTKINPTKYKVTIHGAKDPYTLILSEKFNSNWKAFIPNGTNEAKTLKGFISRILRSFMTSILHFGNIVVSSEASNKNSTSYFNNKIIEGMHKDIFLDQSTFQTFGQDPIVENTHLTVNGYANSWYIRPQDVQNKEDYELIIEMTSQKLFYVCLLISVGGLLLLFIFFLKSLLRK